MSNPNPCTPNEPVSEWTEYQATMVKHVTHGKIVMSGQSADSMVKAELNLQRTKEEYVATGAWGGADVWVLAGALGAALAASMPLLTAGVWV